MSVPITIVKEDSKMEAFRKNFTCQECKEVTKYKKEQVFKGGKYSQNYH